MIPVAQMGLLVAVLKEGRQVLSVDIDIGGAGEGVAPLLNTGCGRTNGGSEEDIAKGDMPVEAAAAAAAAIGERSVAPFSRK